MSYGRALALLLFLPGLSISADTLNLPTRPAHSPSGSEFAERIAPLALPERDEEICAQVLAGNVPEFLRKLVPIAITNVVAGKTNTALLFVTPDYLAVGSDEDYFLTPMSPYTAQRIADALHCSLPTPKIVDAIYAAAEVKLPPVPIPPSAAMTTVRVFSNHNAVVRAQRAQEFPSHPLGALVAGHKKDVVISAKLPSAPGKVAIYGWHQTNGAPIQPLYLKHTAAWVDYSQCIRLVQQRLLVNGATQTVAHVLADPALAALLSDEGVVTQPRYVEPPGFTGWQEVPTRKERIAAFTLEPEVKVHINSPDRESFTPGKRVMLIFYALPNGNTTAQTIGKAVKPGDDWHYDIQHIGAQTRFLREVLKDRVVVVCYLEAQSRSWPAWRKAHGDSAIPDIIATVQRLFAGSPLDTVLTGHSGGGSFIFGYLNAVPSIPDDVVRIAFLDSNYAYDKSRGHEEKLARWLRSSDQHFLCVLAYNDAAALLNDKPFVTTSGGTWGKSHEMQRDLAADFPFTCQTNAEFQTFSALDGRVQFLLKENPDHKILHTVQVERNGFIHCILAGTTNASKGYEYFGPRAYSQWISAE